MTLKPALAAHPYSVMNRFLEEPLITVDQNRSSESKYQFLCFFFAFGFSFISLSVTLR